MCISIRHFNPLPPHGGRLWYGWLAYEFFHFNPLPPHGGRLWYAAFRYVPGRFQSTPSTRRETLCRLSYFSSLRHFNPLPPHGGRLYYNSPLPSGEDISIHSLHTEGDRIPGSHLHNRCNFNPLPPHGGRLKYQQHRQFPQHFNPLPPHGGRRCRCRSWQRPHVISIHSLHTEGDNAI